MITSTAQAAPMTTSTGVYACYEDKINVYCSHSHSNCIVTTLDASQVHPTATITSLKATPSPTPAPTPLSELLHVEYKLCGQSYVRK